MQCKVIVKLKSATRFVACPVGLLQLASTAPTEVEAVEQVKQKLPAWLKDDKVAEVSIPTGNPWLDSFGRSATDPQFDDYLPELQRYREEQGTEGSVLMAYPFRAGLSGGIYHAATRREHRSLHKRD